MEKKVLLYFLAAIFCISAGRTSFLYPPGYGIRTTIASDKNSSLNVAREDITAELTLSVSKRNSCLDFLLYFPEEEKEETEDDETETAEADPQQQSLHGRYGTVMLVNFPRQSHSVSDIPLFILLHSWKHFLG